MYRTWSSNRSVCHAILRFGRHLWPAGTFCLDLMCSVFLARELWHSFKDETLARVSVKFEFRYPGLTSKISFILCNYCFMIEWPKNKWQSHLELFFWTKEKETRVKNILGLITVIGLQTTQVCLSFFSRFLIIGYADVIMLMCSTHCICFYRFEQDLYGGPHLPRQNLLFHGKTYSCACHQHWLSLK